MLTNGEKTPKEQMLEILDGMTAGTWKKDASHLRDLISAL